MNKLPKRKNIRLKDFDYSQNAYYFITICTQNREHFFGQVINGEMVLNHAGEMVEKICLKLENEFPYIKIDKYVFMPNHFHVIIAIVGADSISARNQINVSINQADIESAPTIGDIIQCFKRQTTIEYIKGVKNGIYPPFKNRIWQRGYYDHIIRNEQDYKEIGEYIENNPLKWELDKYYNKEG
jgi:putative transposase